MGRTRGASHDGAGPDVFGGASLRPEDENKQTLETPEVSEEAAGFSNVEADARSVFDEVWDKLSRTRGDPMVERRALFREFQRKLHPDKNLEDLEVATLAFQWLMDARAWY